jgi:hypothetical protein
LGADVFGMLLTWLAPTEVYTDFLVGVLFGVDELGHLTVYGFGLEEEFYVYFWVRVLVTLAAWRMLENGVGEGGFSGYKFVTGFLEDF